MTDIIKPEPDDASSFCLALRPSLCDDIKTSPKATEDPDKSDDDDAASDGFSEIDKLLDTDVNIELRQLNSIITCPLCAGYVITATRIIDCFHVFCKSCIVQYLQHKIECPECGTRVSESAPWQSLRTDKSFQKVVYKLVPGLEDNERNRREEYDSNREQRIRKEQDLHANESEAVAKSAGLSAADDDVTMLDEEIPPQPKIVICLEPLYTFTEDTSSSSRLIEVPLCPIAQKYIRCMETASIQHIIALLKKVLHIPDDIYIYLRFERCDLNYSTRLYEINSFRPRSLQHTPILLKYRGFRNPFLKYNRDRPNSGSSN